MSHFWRCIAVGWGFAVGCYAAYSAFGNRGALVFVAVFMLLVVKPWSEK